MKYELLASDIKWNEIDSTYTIYNYFERIIYPEQDILNSGIQMKKKFKFTPDELLPEEYIAEIMNTKDLLKFINKEIKKGSGNLHRYYIEFYQRSTIPFSILILTLLGLSIASEKKREGISSNLATGLILTFIYLFSLEFLKKFAFSGDLNPLLAILFPNILFSLVMLYFYLKRTSI